MNKSVDVLQILLPQDVLNNICNYLFYSLEQSREQNKQKF